MNTQDRFNQRIKEQWLRLVEERHGKDLAEALLIDREIALLKLEWQEQFVRTEHQQGKTD